MATIHRSHHIERLPANIIRQIIEVLPDKVLRPPTIIVRGTQLNYAQTAALTKAVRNAWCFARQDGTCRLYVNDDGSISVAYGKVGDKMTIGGQHAMPLPDYIFTNQDWYSNHLSVYSVCGSSIISEEVTRAYCLYRDVAERLYIRVKNGNQTLMTLFKGEDDDDVIPQEVFAELDKQFDKENRVYAQEGSKLTSASVSMDGIADSLKAFWLNIFRVAGMPGWLIDPEELNSQYPIDYRETELTRYWEQFALPCYTALLSVWVSPDEFEVIPPNYRSASASKVIELTNADIYNRDAVSAYNHAKARLADAQTQAVFQGMYLAKGVASDTEPVSEDNNTI